MRWAWRSGIAGAVLAVAGLGAAAQSPFDGGDRRRAPAIDIDGARVPYDGRFAFVRLRYTGGGMFGMRRDPPWSHDYPRSDRHLMKILSEITLLRPHMDESNIFALDDPELFNYPVAYMSEPGYWTMNDAEVAGMHDYIAKGGFVIFDDFRGNHIDNLREQLRRVLPRGELVPLGPDHPIFHAFFEVDPRTFVPPYGNLPPVFYGMFEDNDPAKRLLLIADDNNDIGEYWEFSDTGWVPIDLSNEAYKFGVNYIIYGMTH